MKRKGSFIAQTIDREYRKKMRAEKIIEEQRQKNVLKTNEDKK